MGTNATLMVQVLWAAKEVPQWFMVTKSPFRIFAPTSVSATSPALVRVTCCAALDVPTCCCAKVSASGATVSVAGLVPRPLSWAICVPALSVIVRVPVRVPLVVG